MCSQDGTMGVSCSRHTKKAKSAKLEAVRPRRLASGQPAGSLVQACLNELAARPDLTEAHVYAMSADLSQELLRTMVRLKTLDARNVLCFERQRPWAVPLGAYPGVRDDWVAALACAHLLALDVSGCEVDDASARAIAGCWQLQNLNMSKTGITAAGFSHLAGLTRLESLVLSDCDSLDARAADVLQGFEHLQVLDLGLCRHVAPCDLLPHIERCTRLRHLDLSWCRSDSSAAFGDLSSLKGLGALTFLNLSKARFEGATMTYLVCLTKLRSLNLSDHAFDRHAAALTNMRDGPRTQQTEFAILGALTELTNLELRWCQVPDYQAWSMLRNLRALERLDVSFVKGFCDISLGALAPLTTLTYLNLDSTAITNDSISTFSALTNLDYLNLSDTRVEDLAVPFLYKLTKLRGLDMSYAFISDFGVELLREMTSLTYLSVDSRLITDVGLKCLSPLIRLMSLDVYGCKMTVQGARCVAKLPNVTWLDASGGVLCDQGVLALSSMTQLTYLSVSQNQSVTDDAIPHLARLTNLRSLNLSGTKVTAARLLLLASLTALTSLSLYNTGVKPCLAKRMAAAWPEVLISGIPEPLLAVTTTIKTFARRGSRVYLA